MSRREEIEFVCYDERGLYNLDEVIDELLPATLERSEAVPSPFESQRSFHDLLALRSLRRDEQDRKGGFARRASLMRAATRLVGEILVFVGGAAIGAGLMAVRSGEAIGGGAGAIVASGLTAIALSILVRMVSKSVDSSLENIARA